MHGASASVRLVRSWRPGVRPLLRGARHRRLGVQLGLGSTQTKPPVGQKDFRQVARCRGLAIGLPALARPRPTTSTSDPDPGRVALFAADAVLDLLGNSYRITMCREAGPQSTVIAVRDCSGRLLSTTDDTPWHHGDQQCAEQPFRAGPQSRRGIAAVPLGPAASLCTWTATCRLRVNVLSRGGGSC